MNAYLGKIPFAEKIYINDPQQRKSKLWNAMKTKQPKLFLTYDEPQNAQSIKRTLFTLTSNQALLEKMRNHEAMISCYLIPFIIDSDLYSDFLRDEVIKK